MTVDINQIAQEAVKAGGNVYILTIESGSSPTIVFGNNFAGAGVIAKKVGKKEDKATPAPPPPNPPAPPVPPTPEEAPPPPPPGGPGGSLWGAPRQRR